MSYNYYADKTGVSIEISIRTRGDKVYIETRVRLDHNCFLKAESYALAGAAINHYDLMQERIRSLGVINFCINYTGIDPKEIERHIKNRRIKEPIDVLDLLEINDRINTSPNSVPLYWNLEQPKHNCDACKNLGHLLGNIGLAFIMLLLNPNYVGFDHEFRSMVHFSLLEIE